MARTLRRLADENLLIVQVWLVSRLLLAVIAVTLAVVGRRDLGSVLAQWDVGHFLKIASEGYADPAEMAFFPGLPLILRGFTELGLPAVLAGTVLALACSLLAAFALKRIAGTWGAIAWVLAPTAVFTAVPYTEAPFCAAAFWAWERATQRRWGQAALLAALACTLRVSGLFLVGALVILALTQGNERRRRGVRAVTVAVVATHGSRRKRRAAWGCAVRAWSMSIAAPSQSSAVTGMAATASSLRMTAVARSSVDNSCHQHRR